MNDRRSIQDIIPPARSKPIRPQAPITTTLPPTQPPMTQPPRESQYEDRAPRGRGLFFLTVAAAAVIVVIVVVTLMSTVFHSATAQVVLSEWKSDVSGTYSAGPETPLAYQPVVVSETAGKSVPATGTEKAEDHASGMIVVTNTSTRTQRLITNTRFESPEGLIYRIHAPIVVPAATTKGAVTTAGSIEATVYADEPGERYNIGPASFTVPGLKGSQTYTQVTAKSSLPMSGGFVGDKAVVEKTIRDQAVAEIKADLERKLREKVVASTPPNGVVFPDGIEIRYSEEPDRAEQGNATITVRGTALAASFSGDQLARSLASRAGIITETPLVLNMPSDLQYSGQSGNVESGSGLTFTLSGSAHLVAQFSAAQLAEDLAGKTEQEAEDVRSKYPSLVGPMEITVIPFWLSALPKNPERIKVDVRGVLDQNP